MKQNCWQLKNCGRQPGGVKVAQLGVCPAASSKELNGTNSGSNGGRVCWAVAGTFCGGIVQGTFAEKRASCLSCEVHSTIRKEEGSGYVLMPQGRAFQPAQR